MSVASQGLEVLFAEDSGCLLGRELGVEVGGVFMVCNVYVYLSSESHFTTLTCKFSEKTKMEYCHFRLLIHSSVHSFIHSSVILV